MLPKENTITAASIQLGQDKGNVQQIQIKALLSNKWVNLEKPFKVETTFPLFSRIFSDLDCGRVIKWNIKI